MPDLHEEVVANPLIFRLNNSNDTICRSDVVSYKVWAFLYDPEAKKLPVSLDQRGAVMLQ